MTRFVVPLLPEAEAAIREAFLWYRERSALAANGFRAEILAAIDELTDRANAWPLHEDGVRRRTLKRFPFTIYFELGGSAVTVLAVAHHRRFPDYWRHR